MLRPISSFASQYSDWLFLGALFLGALTFTALYRRAHRRMRFWALRKGWMLPAVVLGAIRVPLLVVVWGTFLHYILHCMEGHAAFLLTTHPYYQGAWKVRWLVLAIWVCTRFVSRLKRRFLARYARRDRSDTQVVYSIARLLYTLLALAFAFYLAKALDTPIPSKMIAAGDLGMTWGFITAIIYIVYLAMGEAASLLRQRRQPLAYAMVQRLRWPVVLLSSAWGSYLSLQHRDIHLDLPYQPGLQEIFILTFFWGLYRIVLLLEEHFSQQPFQKGYPDKGMVQGVGKIARFTLLAIGVLLLFSKYTEMAGGLLKLVGGSTFLVGLGAQQIIGNYVSGLVVQLEGPFKVGDWIYTADRKMEGWVEYIGMRTTAIRTLDKRLLHVPNSILASQSFVNATRMTHRRIQESLVLARADHQVLHAITQQIRAMLHNHPGIDNRQLVMAHFTGFSPYGLNIHIYAFTKTHDRHTFRDVRQDIFLKVIKIIEAYGADLAFPTSHVHLQQHTGITHGRSI